MKILAIDVGGTQVKILASGHIEPRATPSGKTMSPARMVAAVKKLAKGWDYDAVSIGFPGIAGLSGPASEPGNLGPGWVGFDFAAAFERPVKMANDAAMQALGSYEGGRMLFLGLGTGLGAALIAEKAIVPMELSELPWNKRAETLGDVLSSAGRKRIGSRRWRRIVELVACRTMKAFLVDYVVIGGGNARRLKDLPHGVRLGHNLTAFRGGFRLWGVDDVPMLSPEGPPEAREPVDWRVI